MTSPLSKGLVSAVRFYQRNISAGLPRRCRYEPTCSAYAVGAIEVHGSIKGTLLAGWRILRCNPLSSGGIDRVPQHGEWPSKPLGYEELMAERAREESGGNDPSSGHDDHGDEESHSK